MNIKKIFAALLASTMVFSSVVAFAENDFATRTPSVTYTVGNKITSQDALTSKNNLLTYNSNYDYYPLTINVSNLGKLYIDKGTDYQVINNICFTFKTTSFSLTDEDEFDLYCAGVAPSVGGTWDIAYDNVNVGNFNMYWTAPKSTINALASISMYPGSKTTIENASLSFEVVLALPAGTTLTIDNSKISTIINYYDRAGQTSYPHKTATVTNNSVSFGGTTNTPWKFTVTEDTKYDNGYIWKVDTTTKGDGDLDNFKVKFTDTNTSSTLEKTINFGSALDWNTTPTFYVGLKTDKTVSADWSASSKKADNTVINAQFN